MAHLERPVRLFPLAFILLAACVTAPTLDEVVLDFQTAHDIVDAEDCGVMDLRECDADDEASAAANQCFADALVACSPAVLEIVSANGDGGETHEVLVIHTDGADECAVQRFATYPNLYKSDVEEQTCAGAVVSTEVCEAPAAESCEAACGAGGEDIDCG